MCSVVFKFNACEFDTRNQFHLRNETRPAPPPPPDPPTSGCFPRGAAVTLSIFIRHAQRLKPLQGPAPGRCRRPDRGAAGVRRPAAAGRCRRPSRSPSRPPGRRRRGPAAAIEARPGPELSAGRCRRPSRSPSRPPARSSVAGPPPPRAGGGDRGAAGTMAICLRSVIFHFGEHSFSSRPFLPL